MLIVVKERKILLRYEKVVLKKHEEHVLRNKNLVEV